MMSDTETTTVSPEIQSAADDHLSRLLPMTVEEPWYKSLYDNVRETFNPPKLPPLVLTSKPVAVKSIWGMYSPDKKNWGYSVAVIVGIIILLGTVFSTKVVQDQVKQLASIDLIAPYIPEMKIKKNTLAGGGGGGDRSPTPASKGKLPKLALKQFVPPEVIVHNEHPKLTMEPTIVLPPDTPVPVVNSTTLGDPLSRVAELSNGTGSGGGIGIGNRGGVGSGDGAGFGPGHGGGTGGGAYRVGGGVSAPVILHQVDPEYSEEARKAKYSGTVLLRIVVDPTGRVTKAEVVRSLGMGLDEKAIEAVNKWKFKPGTRNGSPVPVLATVEVNFRLL